VSDEWALIPMPEFVATAVVEGPPGRVLTVFGQRGVQYHPGVQFQLRLGKAADCGGLPQIQQHTWPGLKLRGQAAC